MGHNLDDNSGKKEKVQLSRTLRSKQTDIKMITCTKCTESLTKIAKVRQTDHLRLELSRKKRRGLPIPIII